MVRPCGGRGPCEGDGAVVWRRSQCTITFKQLDEIFQLKAFFDRVWARLKSKCEPDDEGEYLSACADDDDYDSS